MKTYDVRVFPCVFEHPGIPGEFYEAYDESTLSYLPSSLIDESSINLVDLNVSAYNLEEALCKTYSYIRVNEAMRLPSLPQIMCYSVTFRYLYGRSLRERTYYVWISRAHRLRFLEKNRSYLTREQIISICSSKLPSFDRYLNNDNYGDNSFDASRS